jgi:hypothetical protein
MWKGTPERGAMISCRGSGGGRRTPNENAHWPCSGILDHCHAKRDTSCCSSGAEGHRTMDDFSVRASRDRQHWWLVLVSCKMHWCSMHCRLPGAAPGHAGGDLAGRQGLDRPFALSFFFLAQNGRWATHACVAPLARLETCLSHALDRSATAVSFSLAVSRLPRRRFSVQVTSPPRHFPSPPKRISLSPAT